MLGIAGLIPDQWPLVKQTIIYSSPTASVIIGALWAWGSELLMVRANRWTFKSRTEGGAKSSG